MGTCIKRYSRRRDRATAGFGAIPARAESLERRAFLSASAVVSLYVYGTHGSDPGSGASASLGTTPTNAFRTIQEAANQAAVIDATDVADSISPPPIVVYIEQGIYREMVSVTDCTDVTFMPYENEAVTVSGLDPVQFNSSPDPGTQVWTSQPLYPTDYSATTDQLVLGPSATTATDQVFEDGQMVPESRYPENPLPGSHETNTSLYESQKTVTLLQTPANTQALSTFAETAISDASYFDASFDDPNLFNIAGTAAQRKTRIGRHQPGDDAKLHHAIILLHNGISDDHDRQFRQ